MVTVKIRDEKDSLHKVIVETLSSKDGFDEFTLMIQYLDLQAKENQLDVDLVIRNLEKHISMLTCREFNKTVSSILKQPFYAAN